MINAINSIDKHSLREVEGDIFFYRIYTVIYITSSSFVAPTEVEERSW